jgi:Xaa-Pro aminopeptidase
MRVKERVAALRGEMKRHGVEAYLIPSADAHQSEYVPACWQRRPWISGFTGSAGDVLVTQAVAGLWADGRYFLQAEEELHGSGIRLFRSGQPGVPGLYDFLSQNLQEGQSLGVDPRTVSIRRARELESALGKAKATLRFRDPNLVDAIWSDRPGIPMGEVQALPVKFAGEATASKLKRLRKEMKDRKVHAHVLSALDAIACTIQW